MRHPATPPKQQYKEYYGIFRSGQLCNSTEQRRMLKRSLKIADTMR